MRTSSPRTARAARLLAAVLVPLVALPALAGLVVCTSDAGVTMSWGERPCPKKQSTTGVALTSPQEAATACAVVPDAPLAASPDLRAPTDLAPPFVVAARTQLVAAPVTFPDGPRGPPSGTLRALRTTVLRV